MTRPRWPPEIVAELKRRMAEEGATLQALGDENGVSKQAMWCALNREAFNAYRKSKGYFRQKSKLIEIVS